MKIACVVQASSIAPYLTIFLEHHRKIFDKIFVVLHNTKRFPSRDLMNIEFIDARFKTFFTPLSYACISKKIEKEFDFITFLDVDELIELSNKAELENIAHKNRWRRGFYVRWRPVISTRFEGEHLRVSDLTNMTTVLQQSPTRKTFYNLKLSRSISPRDGNHKYRARSSIFSLSCRDEPTVSLLHIPFLSVEMLQQKLTQNDTRMFWQKISECAPTLSERYGPDWGKHTHISTEDYYNLSINYRTRHIVDHINTKFAKYSEIPDLSIDEEKRLRMEREITNSLERRTLSEIEISKRTQDFFVESPPEHIHRRIGDHAEWADRQIILSADAIATK